MTVSTLMKIHIFRSSLPEEFCKKGVFKNFTIFTENVRARILFLIKLQAKACSFIRKGTLAQISFCEFFEIFKNIFFIETSGSYFCILLIVISLTLQQLR